MSRTSSGEVDGSDGQQLMTHWVRSYTGELVRYARSRVKDPDTADELVQLTFVSAWQALRKFEAQSSPRTWLFAILKHKLADHYRKIYREGVHLSGKDLADDHTNDFDENGHWTSANRPDATNSIFEPDEKERLDRALRYCLDQLPENLRSAVEMKYLLEKESGAIQKELGITATNYWQQLHRAKMKLRSCIERRTTQNE